MTYYNSDLSVRKHEEALQHHGVKGMKWGQRKATVKAARAKRSQVLVKTKDDYKSGKISKDEMKARRQKFKNSETGHVARTHTRGEQTAIALLASPYLAIPYLALQSRGLKKSAEARGYKDPSHKK